MPIPSSHGGDFSNTHALRNKYKHSKSKRRCASFLDSRFIYCNIFYFIIIYYKRYKTDRNTYYFLLLPLFYIRSFIRHYLGIFGCRTDDRQEQVFDLILCLD
jgi:hypothetical protein